MEPITLFNKEERIAHLEKLGYVVNEITYMEETARDKYEPHTFKGAYKPEHGPTERDLYGWAQFLYDKFEMNNVWEREMKRALHKHYEEILLQTS